MPFRYGTVATLLPKRARVACQRDVERGLTIASPLSPLPTRTRTAGQSTCAEQPEKICST